MLSYAKKRYANGSRLSLICGQLVLECTASNIRFSPPNFCCHSSSVKSTPGKFKHITNHRRQPSMGPDRSSDNKPSSSNTRDDHDRGSNANAQDQILLKALQDFLIPFVEMVVDPIGVREVDFKSPEAMNLIIALKAFISNVVVGAVDGHRPKRKIKIENNDKKGSGSMAANVMSPRIAVFHQCPLIANGPRCETPDYVFRKKLMNELQEHVSNKLPIRLLLIEPHDSYLYVSLIDRGAIYTYLKQAMEAKMSQMDFQPPTPEGETDSDGPEEVDKTTKQHVSAFAKYAILSHKWLRGTPGEITYDDWTKGSFDPRSPGYEKLANFCRIAWNDYGITLAWMDTVCINKESSSELDESIRSMYAWYERATICIAYLSETNKIEQLPNDSWFTRGWTLQELLAPKRLKFYGHDWNTLNRETGDDKTGLSELIEQATTMTYIELHGMSYIPFSRRMQWAASRQVTREEDMAYSLMGIFNVGISIAYGEGADRAFYRLLEEIMKTNLSGALDLFNCAVSSSKVRESILPQSPQQYVQRSTETSLHHIMPMEPLTLTSRGVRIPVILMPGVAISSDTHHYSILGDYWATVKFMLPTGPRIPTTFCLLEKSVSGPDKYPGSSNSQLTFAVFNIERLHYHNPFLASGLLDPVPSIKLEQTCIAVALLCFEHVGKRTATGAYMMLPMEKPILFTLRSGPNIYNPNRDDNANRDILIPVDHLARHGMQLLNMYL